jgi:hypothetical protein
MLDEGSVVSVPLPVSRRIRRWWMIAIAAPFVTFFLAWVLENIRWLIRTKKFGAAFWLLNPNYPVVEAWTPTSCFFLAGFVTLALVARFGDRRSIALATLLILPLGFGTARSEWHRLHALPITRPLEMVPDCDVGSSDELLQNNRELTLEEANRIELTGARARWDEDTSEIVIYVDGDSEDALAAQTVLMMKRHEGAPCNRDAFIFDGQPRSIAVVRVPLLWGSLALSNPENENGHRLLFEAMTKP